MVCICQPQTSKKGWSIPLALLCFRFYKKNILWPCVIINFLLYFRYWRPSSGHHLREVSELFTDLHEKAFPKSTKSGWGSPSQTTWGSLLFFVTSFLDEKSLSDKRNAYIIHIVLCFGSTVKPAYSTSLTYVGWPNQD